MLFKLSSHPDSNQLDNQIVKLSGLHVFICIYTFCGSFSAFTYAMQTSVAKSIRFPQNWATLTLLLRVVFHVRGLKRPRDI